MPFELVPAGTNIDFIGKRRFAVAVSIGLLLASAIAVPVRGVKLGIDFAGGTEVQIRFAGEATATEGRIAVQAEGTEVEFRKIEIGPLPAEER